MDDDRLFHGTSMTAWETIRAEGLRPGPGVLGRGVYLATGAEVARRYATGHVTPPWGRETEAVVLAVPGSAVTVRRFQGTTVLVDEVPAGLLEVVEVVRAGDGEAPLAGLHRGMAGLGVAARAMTEVSAAALAAFRALNE